MQLTGGGATNIGSANITDGSITLADMAASARVDTYVRSSLTLNPLPNWPLATTTTDGVSNTAFAGNTTQHLCQFKIDQPIVVNKISIYVASVNVAGACKVAIYDEDGQTKLTTVTSGSISGAGVTTLTLGAALTLKVGIYYVSFLNVGGSSLQLQAWALTANVNSTLGTTGVASKPVPLGKATVTADTEVTTFTPSSLTADTAFPVIRLDN